MQAAEYNHLHDIGDCIVTPGLKPQSSSGLNKLDNRAESVGQSRTSNHTLVTHADLQWDGHEYSVGPTQAVANYHTTFRVYDIDSSRQERRDLFDQLWRLQTGRGHTWEDDKFQKTFVRRNAMWKRCDAILQSCETPEWVRKVALRKTLSRDLQSFCRYYSGADGACVGFALKSMFDHKEEAKSSWIASRAADAIPSFDQSTVESLIDLVFEKYD